MTIQNKSQFLLIIFTLICLLKFNWKKNPFGTIFNLCFLSSINYEGNRILLSKWFRDIIPELLIVWNYLNPTYKVLFGIIVIDLWSTFRLWDYIWICNWIHIFAVYMRVRKIRRRKEHVYYNFSQSMLLFQHHLEVIEKQFTCFWWPLNRLASPIAKCSQDRASLSKEPVTW